MAAGAGAASACAPISAMSDEQKEVKRLAWREYIKGNYRTMTEEERADTIARLERLAKVKSGADVTIQSTGALPGVVFGYAFNISK
ncbi:MAG: 4Fe-4S dicluster domain-containing protein, partial [Gemmatimonadaceae bacterium]